MPDMFDGFHLPSGYGYPDTQIFNTPTSLANGNEFMTWRKPKGKTMLYIFLIGSGGGGGGGFTAAAAAARAGGGGGGGSAHATLIIPLFLIPDVLYVLTPLGGQGGVSGGQTPGVGNSSVVSLQPNSTLSNILLQSQGAGGGAGAGGTGTGSTAGAAGAAGTAPAIGQMPLAAMGIFVGYPGVAGLIGGAAAGANGGGQTIPVTGALAMGGGAGAGTTSADFIGGGVTAISSSLLSEQRPATPASGSNDGGSGAPIIKPLWFWGGLGGSSSNSSTGGNGGYGNFGAGGGGGGGGTTGGRGGDGGGGLAIFHTW